MTDSDGGDASDKSKAEKDKLRKRALRSVPGLRGTLDASEFDGLVKQSSLAANEKGRQRLSDDAIRRARLFFVDGLSNYEISKREDVSEQYLGKLIRRVYEVLYSDFQPVLVHVPRDELPEFLERYKDWIK